ncbi:hypothetical protein [Streptomyces sp. NPDC086777]|uniref:hypothetical protein n=1 Tax=Streptomyces sp. NPDC086777 TaxID=3154866 RepID=UPI00344C3C67
MNCAHERRAAVREASCNDDDETTAQAALSPLTADAPAGVAFEPVTVTAERYGAIPHSNVVCTRDNAIRTRLQRLMVQEIDALSARPTTVVEIDPSHSPFLSRPGLLADHVQAAHASTHRPGPTRTAGV